MLNRLMAIPLSLILSLATLGRAAFAQPQARDTAYAARVKTQIARRSAGRNAPVTVKLRNGQELQGRIDQTTDSTFRVTEEMTGKSTHIAYSEVRSVRGRGLSKGKKIGIIASLAVGVVVLVGVLSFKNFHPFENRVLR